MFGYIGINKLELKMKDYNRYKAYYCGLCRTLQEKYGPIGQATLTYDMTFFVILLTSLYESETKLALHRCVVHPIKKQNQLRSVMSEYAADMNVLMSYYHFLDDWQDEKAVIGLAGYKVLSKDVKKLMKKYPRQCKVIEDKMQALSSYEKTNETALDLVSGCFGDLLGEILVYLDDQWSTDLRRLGFFLGKFIYIMDAYEDLESDKAKGLYNPLVERCKSETFDEDMEQLLLMMMAECTASFEKLPCIVEVDILRNILYNGVWNHYDLIKMKQKSVEV